MKSGASAYRPSQNEFNQNFLGNNWSFCKDIGEGVREESAWTSFPFKISIQTEYTALHTGLKWAKSCFESFNS